MKKELHQRFSTTKFATRFAVGFILSQASMKNGIQLQAELQGDICCRLLTQTSKPVDLALLLPITYKDNTYSGINWC